MYGPTTAPPREEDIPFVESIITALKNAGHANPEFWIACMLDGRPVRLNSISWDNLAMFDQQRFAVNSQFDLVLGGWDPFKHLPNDAAIEYMQAQQRARFCLLPQGDRKTWMKTFIDGVIPVIIKYNLPNAAFALPEAMQAA